MSVQFIQKAFKEFIAHPRDYINVPNVIFATVVTGIAVEVITELKYYVCNLAKLRKPSITEVFTKEISKVSTEKYGHPVNKVILEMFKIMRYGKKRVSPLGTIYFVSKEYRGQVSFKTIGHCFEKLDIYVQQLTVDGYTCSQYLRERLVSVLRDKMPRKIFCFRLITCIWIPDIMVFINGLNRPVFGYEEDGYSTCETCPFMTRFSEKQDQEWYGSPRPKGEDFLMNEDGVVMEDNNAWHAYEDKIFKKHLENLEKKINQK